MKVSNLSYNWQLVSDLAEMPKPCLCYFYIHCNLAFVFLSYVLIEYFSQHGYGFSSLVVIVIVLCSVSVLLELTKYEHLSTFITLCGVLFLYFSVVV